jgi:hypothetical protein
LKIIASSLLKPYFSAPALNLARGSIIGSKDKTDPENHTTHEFQPNEIFKASDVMVDALTKLLDSERNKRKVS